MKGTTKKQTNICHLVNEEKEHEKQNIKTLRSYN